jgi:hypothetical protein
MNRDALKDAFNKAVEASVEIDKARKLISDLHSKVTNVETSKYLLEKVGEWAAPSDDAHEVLFERLTKAEAELNDAFSNNTLSLIKTNISNAKASVSDSLSKLNTL